MQITGSFAFRSRNLSNSPTKLERSQGKAFTVVIKVVPEDWAVIVTVTAQPSGTTLVVIT